MGYLLNFVLFDLGFWDVLFDFSLDSDLLLCVLVYIFLSPLATVFIYTLYPFSHRFVTLRIRYPHHDPLAAQDSVHQTLRTGAERVGSGAS